MTDIPDNLNPLLAADSPLDDKARSLVQKMNQAERDKKRSREEQTLHDDARRRRVEFTRDELWGQPAAIRTTLEQERQAIAQAAARIGSHAIDRIYLIGCGDSLGAMVGVRAAYERLLSVPCEPMQALDFAYYYHSLVNDRTLVIALSSSGVTARVVEGLLLARALGARTLALTNTMNSPLMQESEQSIFIHATRKGWPTQSTTAAMAILYQFAFDLARSKGIHTSLVSELEQELNRSPERIEAVLQEHDPQVKAVAEKEAFKNICLYAGGGPSYASAIFGAAKLKECALTHAVAIPLEEYHHYVSQREGDPLFLIAPTGPTLPRAIETARSGRTWGGTVYGIITKGDQLLKENVDLAFELPPVNEFLAPMVYSVPVQLFAYYAAMALFAASPAKTGA